MTQPTKREQLAAMRLEDFKAHLRTIAVEIQTQRSAAQRTRIHCWCAIARRQRERQSEGGADQSSEKTP
jgi:hypothetical protein